MNLLRRFTSTTSRISSVNQNLQLNFVPYHQPPTEEDVNALQNFLEQNSRIFVITGAGCSTESGIPDYRSEGVGLFAKSKHKPIKIQEFLSSSTARTRYWARNFFAWPRFSSFQPNLSHKILHEWEQLGKINCLVTQNVDGLHKKAGSTDSIELHGTSHRVVCISCDYTIQRRLFQDVLLDLNTALRPGDGVTEIRPDGDIDIDSNALQRFVIPPCPSCGGLLKPDIVFFGDNVPRDRVFSIYDKLNTSDSVLVLGSTLQTFSAFRYIMGAKQLQIPIAIVTLGTTRADGIADLKLTCRVGELLSLIKL